jgi:hypothetical protein
MHRPGLETMHAEFKATGSIPKRQVPPFPSNGFDFPFPYQVKRHLGLGSDPGLQLHQHRSTPWQTSAGNPQTRILDQTQGIQAHGQSIRACKPAF